MATFEILSVLGRSTSERFFSALVRRFYGRAPKAAFLDFL